MARYEVRRWFGRYKGEATVAETFDSFDEVEKHLRNKAPSKFEVQYAGVRDGKIVILMSQNTPDMSMCSCIRDLTRGA